MIEEVNSDAPDRRPLAELHVRVVPTPHGPRVEVRAPLEDPDTLLAMIGHAVSAFMQHQQRRMEEALRQAGNPQGQIDLLARLNKHLGGANGPKLPNEP